jgi:hypothetical protein
MTLRELFEKSSSTTEEWPASASAATTCEPT